MAEDLISDIIDQAAIERQLKFIDGGLDDLAAKIKAFSGLKITLEGADSTKKLVDANNQYSSSLGDVKKSQDQLSISIKEYQRIQDQNAQLQAKLNAATSDAAKKNAEYREQINLSNKANKEIAQNTLGLVDAYGKLKKEYNDAAAAAKNLSAIALGSGNKEDISKAEAATAKAKALHDSLLQIETGVGQAQRNVGNYTGALKVLEKALADAKQKLDSMSQSERENTVVGQNLQKEVGLLSTLAGQQDKGFVSLRREVMNATQALATMAEQGLAGTPAFKALQIEVANAKRGLLEFNNQQKLLSSEAPALAALTAAARGLGAAYAVGAGAAALFGDGNEKVEKELQKLVAIMTVLQGLTELNRFLQERTAIATALSNAATGIGNGLLAIKNFVLTGSTKALAQNTIAQEVNTAATIESGVAAKVATGAMIGLRGALIATGIGALLIMLPSIASAFGLFGKKAGEASSAINELRKREEEANKAIDDSANDFVKATQAVNELRINVDLAKEGFLSKKKVVEEYNEGIGKTIGTVQNLDQVEQKLTEHGDAYIRMMLLKAAANIALEEAAKKAFEVEQNRRKKELEFQSVGTNATVFSSGQSTAPGFVPGLADINAGVKARTEAAKKEKEEKIKTAEDEKNGLLDIAKKFQEDAAKIAKDNKFDFFGGKENGKNVKEKQDEFIRESLKRQAEFDKQTKELISKSSEDQIKALADKYKSESLDQEKSFTDRITALQNFNAASFALIQKQKERELQSVDDKSNIERQNAIDAFNKSKKTAEEKKVLADELNKIEINRDENKNKVIADADKQLSDLQISISTETTKLVSEGYKKLAEDGTKAYKEIADAIERAAKNKQDENEISKNERLLQLDRDFQSGKIRNIQEYQALKQKIEDDATIKDLLIDEERIRNQEKIFGKTLDLEKQFSDDEVTINAIKNKKILDQETQLKKDRERLQDESLHTLEAFIQGDFDRQKNRIQDEINLNDEKTKREIDAITKSGLAEKDKADRIAIVQANSANKKTELEKKQKDADIKRAKFERAFAIAEIAINTARAVSATVAAAAAANLAHPELLGAAGAPILAQIPFEIAIGAAQVAAILAKPIPTFEKGTPSAPKGLALVSEKGSELVIPKSGTPYLTPPTPSLMNLMGGEQILPADITKTIMNSINPLAMIMKMQEKNNRESYQPFFDDNRIVRELRDLNKAARNADKEVVIPIELTPYYQFHIKH